MSPGVFDLLVYHGDSYRWQFTFWSDTAKQIPSDLTGATVNSEIRDKPGGSVITSLDCVVTLPNIVVVTMTSTMSSLLTSMGGVWDLQLTYPSNDIATVVAGYVRVTMDVTL